MTSIPREIELDRSLGRWQLTMLGVSNAIGAGVLVLAGSIAANLAGPAAAISFAIAGLVCLLTALCYGELSSLYPDSGSAYAYALASFGRPVGWMVGWNLILGYLVAASTVAVGWSGYLVAFLARLGVVLPPDLVSAPFQIDDQFQLVRSEGLLNVPALIAVLGCTAILAIGVKRSATANVTMVVAKLTAIGLFVILCTAHIDPANWEPFIPENTGQPGRFGWSGIMAGAVLAFFSYTGFEVISTSSQESRNPRRDVPFALLASFWICALLYISVALVMTGVLPYSQLATSSPLDTVLQAAFPDTNWLGLLINGLIVFGLVSAILVSMYGQTRIFLAMGRDRLIPESFSRIEPRSRVPLFGTLATGAVAGVIAAILPLEILGELVSMGLLLCFASVCLAVIVQRRRQPHVERSFRVPFYPITPVLGAASCVYLVASLPAATWGRLALWLLVGLVIFLIYGARRDPVAPNLSERD